MHPILIKTNNFVIFSYFVMLAAGFTLAVGLAIIRARRINIEAYNILMLGGFIGLSASAGAKLIIGIWQPEIFLSFNKFAASGLSFHGGLIGGILGAILYGILAKLPVIKLFDLAAPSISLAYGITRIGCFLNGCCRGISTNLFFGVKFPDSATIVHPTQLYSSLASFLICIVLLLYEKRKRFEGEVFLLYLLLYSIYRFIVEFFRKDMIVFIGGLTYGQVGSILIGTGALLLILFLKPNKSEKNLCK